MIEPLINPVKETNGASSSSAGGLDLALAYRLMQASAQAYTAAPSVHDERTDTNVLFIEDADSITIALRGSKSLLNFLTDAKAWKVARIICGKYVRVHSGFDEAISRVFVQILAYVACGTCKKIFVCGHSLGGALAVLCALKLNEKGIFVDGCYTYGQPHVGNAAFAALCQEKFGDRHFRFEDEEDVITRVPLIGYWHSGQNIFLPTLGGYRINPSLWLKVLSDAWGIYRARSKGPLAFNELILCHLETRYLAKLQAALNAS